MDSADPLSARFTVFAAFTCSGPSRRSASSPSSCLIRFTCGDLTSDSFSIRIMNLSPYGTNLLQIVRVALSHLWSRRRREPSAKQPMDLIVIPGTGWKAGKFFAVEIVEEFTSFLLVRMHEREVGRGWRPMCLALNAYAMLPRTAVKTISAERYEASRR